MAGLMLSVLQPYDCLFPLILIQLLLLLLPQISRLLDCGKPGTNLDGVAALHVI